MVTVSARTPNGRTDTEIGALSIKGLTGDSLCNAMMKALTKSKRRVTLSICGLGLLDESEVDSIPGVIYSSQSLNSEPLPDVWRTWKTPTDALNWGATILPDLTPTELQELFDSVLSVNGKKAPAFVEKVLDMAVTF